MANPTKAESHNFEAETDKLLKLMIHSLYTESEIFLRELISNASDALDKRRYLSLTNDKLNTDSELKISIEANEKSNSLTIRDNGIGMNKKELVNNLGVIASSGTQKFLEKATGDKEKDIQLIGQFGVGFYSSFMVADKVTVKSRKAGEKKAWQWQSKGNGKFSVKELEEELEEGTEIILSLREEKKEFTDKFRISHIVKTYSNHIPFAIEFTDSEKQTEQLNDGTALWNKPKSQINEEDYTEFYKKIAHASDNPWLTLHNKVEGNLDYTNLLFIPSVKPFDLFHPDRKTRVKLYVRKVFISEENIDLIPKFLRFVQGIVNSEDLPLNISRESLQHNNIMTKITNSIVKKILSELKKKAEKDPESYDTFWNNFGAILKEGLCEHLNAHRELLLEVCRFKTSKSNGKLISLSDYVKNMKENQNEIYYLIGDNADSIKSSPQLEGFIEKDIEVILLTDPVDDFWVGVHHEYGEKPLKSITRSGINLDDTQKSESNDKKEATEEQSDNPELLKFFKETLDDKVKEVVLSKKLSESPVCLTVPEDAMDIRMEKFLLDQKQLTAAQAKILEINPNHQLVKHIAENLDNANSRKLVEILFDQACILEGEKINDTGSFAKRLNDILIDSIAA